METRDPVSPTKGVSFYVIPKSEYQVSILLGVKEVKDVFRRQRIKKSAAKSLLPMERHFLAYYQRNVLEERAWHLETPRRCPLGARQGEANQNFKLGVNIVSYEKLGAVPLGTFI